jgi:hypothetical protein
MQFRRRFPILWPLVMSAAVFSPVPLFAREDPSALCLRAASDAAAATGVPYDVLLAIALVETGRDARPWPWTVNAGGDGRWFDSADEAEAHVAELLDQGVTNVDLGCFQLNHRWHSGGFASVADMLDPDMNAAYAARFLARLYGESGDWATAAAAYHSKTPEYAKVYRAKFEAAFAGLSGAEPPAEAEALPDPDRTNSFPLLVVGGAGRNGSLVPATSGGRRLIGGS